jgi:hypothetical protein
MMDYRAGSVTQSPLICRRQQTIQVYEREMVSG